MSWEETTLATLVLSYSIYCRVTTTHVTAEVQIARGYSSPLLGPNALGGSINLVTHPASAEQCRPLQWPARSGVQQRADRPATFHLHRVTCEHSFAGCTAHVWNFNPQASISYTVGQSDNLFLTFADRDRSPMLKDIYSASLGAGLPNPNLKPERRRSLNLGYSHLMARGFLKRAVYGS